VTTTARLPTSSGSRKPAFRSRKTKTCPKSPEPFAILSFGRHCFQRVASLCSPCYLLLEIASLFLPGKGCADLMSGRPAAPVRVDGMMFSFGCWSSGWFEHAVFAHALASEFDAVGIVNDAIEDRATPAGQPRRPLALAIEHGAESYAGDWVTRSIRRRGERTF